MKISDAVVERAAIAAAKANSGVSQEYDDGDLLWSYLDGRAKAHWRRVARVVLEAAIAAQQPAAVDGLAARLVDELDGLVSESGGVSGLHLNGDVATWEELLPGGRFERLSSLDELREALATQHQGDK